MGRHRSAGEQAGRWRAPRGPWWARRGLALGVLAVAIVAALGPAAPGTAEDARTAAFGVTGRLGAPPFGVLPPAAGPLLTPPPADPGAPLPVGAEADIPARVLAAYDAAAARESAVDPGCGIDRALVAGIGKVESDHAAGGRVEADGRAVPAIRGPVLDGSTPGTAVLPDTDGGVLDDDPAWERAVGPTQFLPATWRAHGVDGDADAVADPDDVDDATAATASYLCGTGGDLRDDPTATAAVLTYNHSTAYADTVLAWARFYRGGVLAVPDLGPGAPALPEAGALPPGPVDLAAAADPASFPALPPDGGTPAVPAIPALPSGPGPAPVPPRPEAPAPGPSAPRPDVAVPGTPTPPAAPSPAAPPAAPSPAAPSSTAPTTGTPTTATPTTTTPTTTTPTTTTPTTTTPTAAGPTTTPGTPATPTPARPALPGCAVLLPSATTARVLGGPVVDSAVTENARDVRCTRRTAGGSVTLRVRDTADTATATRLAAERAGPDAATSGALPGARVVDGGGERTVVAARGPVLVVLTAPATVTDQGLVALAAAVRDATA